MMLSEPECPIGAEGGKAGRTQRNRRLPLKMLTFQSHCAGYRAVRGGSVCPLGGITVNNKPCGAAGNRKSSTQPAVTLQRLQEKQTDENVGALVMNNQPLWWLKRGWWARRDKIRGDRPSMRCLQGEFLAFLSCSHATLICTSASWWSPSVLSSPAAEVALFLT